MILKKKPNFFRIMLPSVFALLPSLQPAQAAPIPVGNDFIEFNGVLYDMPPTPLTPPESSTWFYTITSGSQPAISHVTFETDGCARVIGAGTWTDNDVNLNPPYPVLNQGGGMACTSAATDPTTLIFGCKFNLGFNSGEVRHYYITLDKHYDVGEITFVSKAGPTVPPDDYVEVPGPNLDCKTSYPLTVEKDAQAVVVNRYDWEITKDVSPAEHNMFAGAPGEESTYTINVDQTVDTSYEVEGAITIENIPDVGTDPQNASITAIVDTVMPDGINITDLDCQDENGAVATPSVALPYTLPPDKILTCNYIGTLNNNSSNQFNTVDVMTAADEEVGGVKGNSAQSDEIDFSTATTKTEGESVVDVVDEKLDKSWTNVSGDIMPIEPKPTKKFTCPPPSDTVQYIDGKYSYEYTNTAEIQKQSDGSVIDSDDAKVTVNCYIPVVDKTVKTSYDLEHVWDVEKKIVDPEDGEVDSTTLNMNVGDDEDVNYKLTLNHSQVAKNFAVSGDIYVTNPHPTEDMTVVVSDNMTNHGAINVVCDGSGNASLTVGTGVNNEGHCSYSADLTNNTTRKNTATATLYGNNYSSNEKDVNFANTNPADIGSIGPTSVKLEDWLAGADSATIDQIIGIGDLIGDTKEIPYPRNFACPDDEGNQVNTVTIKDSNAAGPEDPVLDQDQAEVTVNCHEPIVEKTATTTFDRKYIWDIDKSATNVEGRVLLPLNTPFNVSYEVTVDASSEDSNYQVTGNITVTNPNPDKDMSVHVTDTLSNGVVVQLSCPDPLIIGPGTSNAEGTCTYAADLTDSTSLTNTAKVTVGDYPEVYSNYPPEPVTFSDPPTTETDKCVEVDDTMISMNDPNITLPMTFPLPATVCADEAPQTFSYSIQIQYDDPSLAQDCTDPNAVSDEIPNVASFDVSSTPDSGANGSDDELVKVCITTSPPGCTLTQGYWKTHSKYGPAPYDDTWQIDDGEGGLIDLEDEPFFLSGMSYYDVLWETPKGGNAYYLLAHQWIAAYLNELNGALVADDLGDAQMLLEVHTPEELALKGKTGNALRADFIELANSLDAYNNGETGPGHCSENTPE